VDVDSNGKIKKYAIKRIFPTINAAFIVIEMLILKYLNGENNVTELIQAYRLEGQVSLVFRFQKSQPFLSFLNEFTLLDVKHYMWSLLKAVEHLSNHGIIHRDIKPANFLYDRETRTGLLIDFGLSELELNQQG
jgi:cell division control protein 7